MTIHSRLTILLLAMMLCRGAWAASPGVAYRVYDLRCENLRSPLGIDNAKPHFSWKLSSTLKGDEQTAYQIQVATDDNLLLVDKADVWDSGRQVSGSSVMVGYGGRELLPRGVYYWRVRSWNKGGQVSEWSETSRFGVGAIDGLRGEYVGISASDGDVHSPLVRKKVAITPGRPVVLHVNSLGYHEVYANGRKVGDNVLSPAVSQLTRRSLIVSYDLTPYIGSGAGVADIVVWIGQGWYKSTTFKAVYEGPLVKAEVCQPVDGRWQTVDSTDASWTVREGGYRDTGTWYALQFGGERVDGSLVPADMGTASLDRMLWHRAMVRDVPGMKATPQMCEPNRVIARVRPVSVRSAGRGEWLVDMGRVLTGWLEMRVQGLPKGHEVRMEYTDHIGRGAQFASQGESDVYVAAGHDGETFRNKFNHHAYRYVRIVNMPSVPDVTALQVSGGYSQSSTFECSDGELNSIHDMIQYTMRCLTFSGYMVDCPHLERTGYGGDGNSSTMALQTMYDVSPTYYNWLQAWGDVIEADGGLPHVAPAGGGGGGPYWCGFIVKAPWRTMLNYGDPRTMERRYDDMKRWLGYVDKHSAGGLLGRWPDTPNRMWFLGDWLAPAGVDAGTESSVMLVSNCLVSDCFDSMARMASLLGKDSDRRLYERKRAETNRAIHERYYNPATMTYATGSPLDMAYPLLVGAVPAGLVEAVNNKLVALSYDRYKGHIAAGLVGVPVFTDWAVEYRAADLMCHILKQHGYPGYLHMIDNGATTTWEYWSGERSRVHNCYNGIATWFYQALGGVRADESAPGCRHTIIEPQHPRGVSWVRMTRETPYGPMGVDWNRSADTTRVVVTLPVSATATYVLPEGVSAVTVDGRGATPAGGRLELVSGVTTLVYGSRD